ncbi:MAG: metallophosphoesterase [Candidatus Altiarchaeota archaeon]
MSSTIVAIGDSHLGFRHRLSVERLRDFDRAFLDAIKKAKKLEPVLWLFAGDLAHHSRPNPVSMRLLVKTLREIADKAPVVVAIGNHEIEGHLGTTYSPLYADIHENIHVLSTENPIKIVELGGEKVNVLGFQFIRNKKLAEESLRDLSKNVEKKEGSLNILFLHQAIERYLEPHEIGLPVLREAAQKFDLILSGHVHKHQRIKEVFDVTPAYYIGSTERVSFNEADHQNGFMVFEDFDFSNPRFIGVDSRPMKSVTLDAEKMTPEILNKKIAEIIEENKDVKLLQINIDALIDGNFLDVRRDWEGQYKDFTVLDVNVNPKLSEKTVQLEKPELNEDLITEYFEKMGLKEQKELLETTLELYRKYGG